MMLPVTGSVLLLMFLYFIQGLPYGLQAQFLPVYLRSKGVDLTDIGLLKIVYAPWLCKFLWGPLVDQLSTKRRWLLVSILCLAVTCVFGAFFPPDFLIPIIIVLFLLNLFASIQDVAVDAIAIRLLTCEELGQGNTVQVVGYKLGSIFGGGILASFVHAIGWMGLFLVLAVVYVEAAMFIFVAPGLRNLDVVHRPRSKNEDEPAHEKGNNFDSSCSDERLDDETSNDPFFEDVVGNCVGKDADSRDWRQAKRSRRSCHGDAFPHGSKSTSSGRVCSHCVDSTPGERDRLDRLERATLGERATSGTESGEVNVRRFHNTFRQVLSVPGTYWMMSFLLIFKLGEQGALNMLPLFFLDKKVDPAEVTFWTGVVGQGVSICGSVIGGWFVTVYRRIPLDFMLQQLCLLRLLPVGAQLLLVVIWDVGHLYREALFYVAIVMLLLLLLLSGIITTVTFTFMMQCSRSAATDIQATHYTTLATVEVLGKLAFTAACGWFADVFGYRFLFLSFAVLSVFVLPLLKACPEEITCLESVLESDLLVELELSDGRDKAE